MSSVVINLTRRDLIDLELRSRLTWRRLWPTVVTVFALVIAYVAYTRGVPSSSWNWFALVVAGVGGALGAVALGLLFSLAGILLLSGRAPGVLGLHEYTFMEHGLIEKTDANETLIKWNGAYAITRAPTHLQIEIVPGLAHILPRRAFPDGEAYDAFCERAARLVKKHA